MKYDRLQAAARERHLSVLGAFHPDAGDAAPPGCQTLILLGPDEPDFWPAFVESPEWRDGAPDPMDRWSTRVIAAWAAELGAEALFPFGGPPFQPFYSWALRSGRCHASPVKLLVHDTAGLFVSFRGALALQDLIGLPPVPMSPCMDCVMQPCTQACSIRALTPAGYDVPKCKSHLVTAEGQDNRSMGCAVRRACPVSQASGRVPEQSAYHMAQFLGPAT